MCFHSELRSGLFKKKKKLSTDTIHKFFFIPCHNYHFNSTWISDLYVVETRMKVDRSAFSWPWRFVYFKNMIQCQLQPISHSSMQHKCIFLLFPCRYKQSCDLQGLTRLTILTYSHHISKMMLLLLYGCTLLMQSREQKCTTMYHERNGTALCSLILE